MRVRGRLPVLKKEGRLFYCEGSGLIWKYPVFTTDKGESSNSLYKALIRDLLTETKLRDGPSEIPRSTYSFRHTYATFRLSEGVDVYFLAQQMGASVKMIEDHYGHVNAVKHADRVLHGMGSWEPVTQSDEFVKPETGKSGKAGTARSESPRPRKNPKSKRWQQLIRGGRNRTASLVVPYFFCHPSDVQLARSESEGWQKLQGRKHGWIERCFSRFFTYFTDIVPR